MKSKFWLLLFSVQLLSIVVVGQTSSKRQQVLQVTTGGFISFKSEASTIDNKPVESNQSLAALIYSHTMPDENRIIHRVITDSERRVIFGYDLLVNSDPITRKFSLVVLPSNDSFRRTFLKDATRKIDDLFATFPRSAKPQTLDDGDAVSLELLINPETGMKIIDVVRVTFNRSTLMENSLDSIPKDFTLDAVALSIKGYQLLVDGELAAKSRAKIECSGTFLWLYVPGRGRFIFSLVPRDGYSFQKIGVVEGNRIEFSVDGEHFEWLSGSDILPNGGTWNLWVLRDPLYTPLFGSEKVIKQEPGILEKLDKLMTVGSDDNSVKLGVLPNPKGPNVKSVKPLSNKNQGPVPLRVMIGGADTMENLLPKGP